ncbi:hypothetical protein [Streptomyces canus]|uniref:hypothetical protein n=1 Tax=Streptomyces canus TaxID=58343 RepID=UPI000370CCF0|nr:hypothetical protein [Streptomyces canus]
MPGELDRERERIAEAGREALADIQRASAEASAAVVRVVEQQTGVTLAAAKPAVMDAHFPELARMERQAAAYVEAMRIVRQWMLPSDPRALGELMPGLLEDVHEQIADNLIQAGLS